MTPFTGFAPDLDPTTPGIITECENLIPTIRGFRGAPSGADVGMDALAAAALSATLVVKLDGSSRLFAATTTKIYEKSSISWTDRSRATPAYAATFVNPWRCAQFGNTTLAVNKADQLQSSSSGAFANLNAPSAGAMCTWKGFVVLGNTSDGGAGTSYGDSPDRWWTSAYLDETDWTPNVTTQCTTGQLVETAGKINGLKVLGEYIIAYKDESMYIGRDAGSPVIIQWNLVPGEVGCASQDAIADIGSAHIFIGKNDIWMFDGTVPRSIGTPIREWFFEDADPGYTYRIRASHDKYNAIVFFYYPRLGSGDVLDGCIAYNYKTDKWGVAHRTIETPVDYITGGYTYATLPITTYASWPEIPYDSPFWTSTTKYVAVFQTDHKIYSLTGASQTASLTSGFYGNADEYTLLSRVTAKFLDQPTTYTMTNYYQDVLGNTWTTDVTTTGSNGRFDVLRSAPWHKVKFDFTGDFEITAAKAETKYDGVL